ncbi:MAG TPA: potassium-transporting ATPase subunit KdpC [Methanocella sp.]|jgi:K+-transporting ATPase KdpC subunit
MNNGKLIYACAALTVLSIVVCGIAYPLAVAILGTAVFPGGAGGSPIYYNGSVVGSKLIGQNFSGQEYFHSRPSAVDYNASASGSSNLGPNNPALIAQVRERMANDTAVPDAVLASGSGLDPDISVENALAQLPRVAAANGLSEDALKTLIADRTQGRFLLWGEPRVNVLELNLAVLDMKKVKV